MTVDGALTRAQSFIHFTGDEARCHYAGAMMLRGPAHGDCTLVMDHAAEACESRELVKAVLDGRGHGVFQGKVIVQRGAQKTDGKQMANALLLSDEAEFDSKPELEIYADDVVCGHGATAGQLDEDLVFYLRARGIPEPEARALAHRVVRRRGLDKIDNEALRDACRRRWTLGSRGNDIGRNPSPCPSPLGEGTLCNAQLPLPMGEGAGERKPEKHDIDAKKA